jgi:hypothetical protein
MTPAQVAVAPGASFEIALMARALSPVSHLPLTLRFDPEVLVVESVETGTFLGDPGAAEVLSDSSTPGRLVLGASRLGPVAGVAGEGVVARVVFRALAAGDGALRFEQAKALDATRAPLAVDARPATVEVDGDAVGPTPERPDRPARPSPEAKKTKA